MWISLKNITEYRNTDILYILTYSVSNIFPTARIRSKIEICALNVLKNQKHKFQNYKFRAEWKSLILRTFQGVGSSFGTVSGFIINISRSRLTVFSGLGMIGSYYDEDVARINNMGRAMSGLALGGSVPKIKINNNM